MYGRVFFVALGLVGARRRGGDLRRRRATSSSSGDISRRARSSPSPRSSTRVYQPLTGLTNARVDLMTSMVSFERVFEVLDAPEAIAGAAGRRRPRRRRAGGSSSTTSRFRYPPAARRPIASLEQHATPAPTPTATCSTASTLDVAPGETVALVGVVGRRQDDARLARSRGSTTSPAGAVRVDGHDVRDLTLASLRAAIGVVSQDPHLFHESIGDNLRYAKPDATDRRARRGVPRRRASTTRSPRCPTATTRSSASAATACRAARSSASRSPGCCSRTRRS